MACRGRNASRIVILSWWAGVGEAPKEVLVEHGFEILMVNGLIHEVIDGVKNKQNITHLIKRAPRECQAECSGSGMGCM